MVNSAGAVPYGASRFSGDVTPGRADPGAPTPAMRSIGTLDDKAVIGRQGLRQQHALLNPKINARQEAHELVLDADDLLVALVPENGEGFVNLGHVASGIMLGAGIGLAGWFALRASVLEIRDATRILRRLRQERKIIRAMHPNEHHAYPWRIKKVRLAEAMLLENNTDKWEQRTRAVFSGGLVTAGAISEIWGYLSTPYLLGGLSPGIAASSAIALTIAAPMVSVFAGANALMQFRRAYTAMRNKKLVKEVTRHNPWRKEAFDAHAFVEGRRRQIRNHALITGAGFTGIAVGEPVTLFAGPYGLAFLVPGIVTVAVANQYESRKIEYNNPMSLEEIQHLALARHIVNDMGLAYQEYRQLKHIKFDKRADYLAGAHLGQVSRFSLKPVRMVQRWMGRARHNHEPAIDSMYRFFGARLALLEEHMLHKIEAYHKHDHEADDEIQGLLDAAYIDLSDIREDRGAWLHESEHLATLRPEYALDRLCKVLVAFGVFRDFALCVMKDKRVCGLFESSSQQVSKPAPKQTSKQTSKRTSQPITLTPKQLVWHVARERENAPAIAATLYEIAEVLMLMIVKARRHSRARELADLALDRKRAKIKLDKRNGALPPLPPPKPKPRSRMRLRDRIRARLRARA